MSVKIRLARGGSKQKPFYRVVVANSTSPRDGDFIEKVGTFNPMLAKDNSERLTLKSERISYWLSQGARPTEKVTKFLISAGIELPAYLKKEVEKHMKCRQPKASKKEEAAA